MHDWITELEGEYKSHKLVVKFATDIGYRCGYVEAPKYLNGYHKDLEDLCVHGGVTYLEKMNPSSYLLTDTWWVGFDCHHAWDGVLFPPKELERFYQGKEVRSLDYCIEECKKLIDQLIELEAKVNKHAPEKEAND